MAAAVLHSDHVNLLVFRYLQESGFESAAVAFVKDWHRPSIFRDPEHLPFAHQVHRNELISLIQTGLYHDELSERVRKAGRRFRWSLIDARASLEGSERHELLDNGADTRPTSSGRRKERPLMRDEFPTPVPKRQRRSEGSETHVNGDAMDVDAASADAEEEGDTASPGAASDAEIVERYDSMEIGTQTVTKTAPQTSTISWTVDKPGAMVTQALWNPSSKGSDGQMLMTVGDDLCRFYQVPESLIDTKQPYPMRRATHFDCLSHVDEPSLPAESSVTAVTWRPDGQGACCAIDGFRDLPSGNKSACQLLLEQRQDGASVSLSLGPPTLDPPGVILAVRYSPSGEYLLALRTDSARSLIQVWKSSHKETEDLQTSREPVAWKLFDHEVCDVAWTEDDAFIVCGDNGLTSSYQIDATQQNEHGLLPAPSITMRGLISRNSSILNGNSRWERVQHDRRTGIAVFASTEERRLCITSRIHDHNSEEELGSELPLPSDTNLEALSFQPSDKADPGASSLLAAAFDDGSCHIYSISRSSCQDIAILTLSDPPATALAWSPDGSQLAISNASDAVQIWSAESLTRKNGLLHPPRSVLTWRAASESNDAPRDYEADEEDFEPSINWSADGESLVFAAKRQVRHFDTTRYVTAALTCSDLCCPVYAVVTERAPRASDQRPS
ncbi:uncharacterized protein MYCFIDRAFT_205799 [Pseudocercospora fijiensis CIRAD86]|uniref:Uncharacterized protein n=1 Tax=Pseudocercospora fijiensis (strain CIRAD86) TaxID=383855 RepID=N1Q7W5_PSEFD|nr:uncharacterized protein MYCFIDRAFT_205799 [Pseudocercospora fijiensis CIRAD86]EME87796.1 hypothetical protein MYCFIDRAFT_205799 [Pseudocercospora fijiensis CIRAD86]